MFECCCWVVVVDVVLLIIAASKCCLVLPLLLLLWFRLWCWCLDAPLNRICFLVFAVPFWPICRWLPEFVVVVECDVGPWPTMWVGDRNIFLQKYTKTSTMPLAELFLQVLLWIRKSFLQFKRSCNKVFLVSFFENVCLVEKSFWLTSFFWEFLLDLCDKPGFVTRTRFEFWSSILRAVQIC